VPDAQQLSPAHRSSYYDAAVKLQTGLVTMEWVMADPISGMKDKTSAKEKSEFGGMGAVTEETGRLARNSCLMTLEAAQHYNAKLFEFARVNSEAAFDYAQELSGVRSPSEFVEITTRRSREQLAVLTEQAKELVKIAQNAAFKSAEPFKGSGQGQS
jgi:hypothetical protein